MFSLYCNSSLLNDMFCNEQLEMCSILGCLGIGVALCRAHSSVTWVLNHYPSMILIKYLRKHVIEYHAHIARVSWSPPDWADVQWCHDIALCWVSTLLGPAWLLLLYLWDSVNTIITAHVLNPLTRRHRRPSFYFLVDLEADWKSWRDSDGIRHQTQGASLFLSGVGSHCPGLSPSPWLDSVGDILCQESSLFNLNVWFRQRFAFNVFSRCTFSKNLKNLSEELVKA